MKHLSYFRLVIFIVALTITQTSLAQTRIYDAFIRGNKVGEMKVVREVNDESEKIYVTTHIEAHMLVRVRVDYESHSTYMDGKLMEAEAISKTNGHVHSQTHTIWKGDHYEVTTGKKTKSLNRQTLFGGDLFYLEEPMGFEEVYALSSGETLEVVSPEANQYYFEHDGKKELHKYINGELSELHLEHKLYTVIFKLQK